MRDLGLLPGDFDGAGLGMNNLGEVVGPSFSSPGPTSGNPRAFLYRDGKMQDLNALVPPDSPLYLRIAYGINDAGQIAGFGVNSNGDIHAFLATPCNRNQVDEDLRTAPTEGTATEGAETTERPRPVLSENARKELQRMLRFLPAGPQPTQPE